MAAAQVAGKVWRDLHADRSARFPDLAGNFFDVLDFTDNAKSLGVDEAIQKLPALDGAIFVQDRHRHVFNVVIQRVPERDHLDERREEHEEQRHRVAQDGDELLEQDRVQAAGGGAVYGIALPEKADTPPVKASSSKLQAPEKHPAPRSQTPPP